jgi:Mn-containing catalase
MPREKATRQAVARGTSTASALTTRRYKKADCQQRFLAGILPVHELMGGLLVPWTAAYIDTIGEPTADLRSNIAAEARAKIIYECLINVTDDPGIKEALGFLMTREIAHQKSFEKALHAIQPNFPQSKLSGNPEFTSVYFNMSKRDDARGPWNEGGDWQFVEEPQPAVDGGDGTATVTVSEADVQALQSMASRTTSNSTAEPTTGAELGADKQV